jgi:hypothetical protein
MERMMTNLDQEFSSASSACDAAYQHRFSPSQTQRRDPYNTKPSF